MEIRSLDHAAFLVADVDRSRRFYRGILEMDEAPRPESFTFPGAWFRKGTAEIHLVGEAEPGRANQLYVAYTGSEKARGYATHIAFEVDDVEQALRELQMKGAPICGEIRNRGDGVLQMYLEDPDGHIVELFSRPRSATE